MALTILILALLGPALVLLLIKGLGVDSLAWTGRLLLWVLAVATLGLLIWQEGGFAEAIGRAGLAHFTYGSVLWGALGACALGAIAGLVALAQRVLGTAVGDRGMYDRIARLPWSRRGFIVFTAAAVEEFLFRGIGVGLGRELLGGATAAALISAMAFTLAHFTWRAHHLVQVASAGAILAALFVVAGGDLWACILAHLLIDGLGFLLMPAIMNAARNTTGIRTVY
jgi:membrane protease YdiL (CAAX protease family)